MADIVFFAPSPGGYGGGKPDDSRGAGNEYVLLAKTFGALVLVAAWACMCAYLIAK